MYSSLPFPGVSPCECLAQSSPLFGGPLHYPQRHSLLVVSRRCQGDTSAKRESKRHDPDPRQQDLAWRCPDFPLWLRLFAGRQSLINAPLPLRAGVPPDDALLQFRLAHLSAQSCRSADRSCGSNHTLWGRLVWRRPCIAATTERTTAEFDRSQYATGGSI